VNPGDNLASIIASAPANSTLKISNDFTGQYNLDLNKPIALVAANPPPIGLRVDATSHLPKIIGNINNSGPNVTLLGINLVGLVPNDTLLTLGIKSYVEQCLIAGSSAGQHRGIRADGKNMSIMDSYIYNMIMDIDTQAIVAWDGCDGLEVDNCYCEANSENILFGGEDAASLGNLPKNITVNNCDLVKPIAWMAAGIAVKNLFEIKAGINIKLTNSRLVNCWTSGQVGYGVVITVRNQSGGAPFTVIQNVLIDGCEMDNVGAGIQFLGTDDTNPSGFVDGVTIHNMKLAINAAQGAGRTIFLSAGPRNVKLDEINVTTTGDLNSFLNFDNPANLCSGFEFDNCQFQEGDYGIFGTSAPGLGTPVLDMYAPGYKCNGNTVVKGTSGRNIPYPSCITVK
jgi:hypothetical protein